MAQDFTTKQQKFIQRYYPQVVALLAAADALTALNTEFSDDFYGGGGANSLTDAVVQAVLPAATAAVFDSAEGAVGAILSTIATNRGYLELIRP